ncbi:GTP-binding protein [Helicobacter sp. T3_23-1056]
MIKTKYSNFLTSASSVKNAPPPLHSEVAILGRSNVGKSTLINEILESNLAKSSSTPGKTKLINFFATQWIKTDSSLKSSDKQEEIFSSSVEVDSKKLDSKEVDSKEADSKKVDFKKGDSKEVDSQISLEFLLIDLPGIGYAKVSKEELKAWQKNLWDFISTRKSIKLFLHLIDSRHTALAIDSMLEKSIKSLLKGDQKYLQVFTKADKLSKNDLAKLHQKNSQNNAIIMAYNNKIPQKYGGKSLLKEAIFNGILGLDFAKSNPKI